MRALKSKYGFALGVTGVAAILSLFLGLDFSNASLILSELRIPRLILALGVGGALALSGLVMQTVLANPLADPYTLGIAAGAAVGAAIGTTAGVNFSVFGLNFGAVIGAFFVILLLLRLGRETKKTESLILLGVMLSMTGASFLAIWMALADPFGVQAINFWLLGDLSRAGMSSAVFIFGLSVLIGFYFWVSAKKYDAFLFGDALVETFGVSYQKTLRLSIVLVSVLVGFCVSAVGMIAFIGLVVPHLVRKQLGTSLHRQLIPLTFIWGAAILTLSDAIAHSLGEPHELPVGAVTAFVGAPVFIYLFIRKKRQEVE